jgi:hypothetical protein
MDVIRALHARGEADHTWRSRSGAVSVRRVARDSGPAADRSDRSDSESASRHSSDVMAAFGIATSRHCGFTLNLAGMRSTDLARERT